MFGVSRALFCVIFVLMFIFNNRSVCADDLDLRAIEKAQGIVDLHLCRDQRLGVELFCNRNWKQDIEPNAVMMIIAEDPAVLLTVARTEKPVTGIEELPDDRIKVLGQYADGFKAQRVRVGGDEAVKVEGFSEPFPEMRLMDFYVVHDYTLYSFLFSVNSRDEWGNYAVLFDKIVQSIKIVGVKNQQTFNSSFI